ncbi:hypothetical protein A6C57_25675 [Fibrella sp. ES10-3-2-2]|nr:hypothetical protein A6C57_25675 [Fibrella sp. ES10-3-2-2]
MEQYIAIILFAIVGVLFFLAIIRKSDKNYQDEQDKELEFKSTLLQLDQAYSQALASGDKSNALVAGRAYYAWIRQGNLTIYDEQALSNDLMAMKTTSN